MTGEIDSTPEATHVKTLILPRRTTRRMREIEERWGGEPIEAVIRRLYLREGLTVRETADRLQISPGTLGTWMVRLHITRRELVAEVALEGCV